MKLSSWDIGELLRCFWFDQPNSECLTRPGDSLATSSISATDIEGTNDPDAVALLVDYVHERTRLVV